MNPLDKSQGISVKELRRTALPSDTNNRWTQLHDLHEVREEKKRRLFDYLYGVDQDEQRRPALSKKSLQLLRNKSANHNERTKQWLDEKRRKMDAMRSKDQDGTPANPKKRKGGLPDPDKTTLYLKPRMVLKDKTAYVLKKTYRDAFDDNEEQRIQIDNLDFLN